MGIDGNAKRFPLPPGEGQGEGNPLLKLSTTQIRAVFFRSSSKPLSRGASPSFYFNPEPPSPRTFFKLAQGFSPGETSLPVFPPLSPLWEGPWVRVFSFTLPPRRAEKVPFAGMAVESHAPAMLSRHPRSLGMPLRQKSVQDEQGGDGGPVFIEQKRV